jgi:hypothetical protein
MIEPQMVEVFWTTPKTQDALKDWIYTYIGLDMPDSHLPDDGSNSSPMEVIWKSFSTYAENKGNEIPGYIWLSSRDSAKTLSGSILAVLLLVFFNATICWLAAIEPQSKIALSNINSFIQKIKPYLDAVAKNIESQNSRVLEIVNADGTRSNITVLVATLASVNGKHTNLTFLDELDLMRDPRVIDEVQAVASLIGGQFPLKLYFSTRKFAFGNMEKIIAQRDDLTLLKWDILDVTEKCETKRFKPELEKVTRFIHPDLPLRNISEQEKNALPISEQEKYNKIEAYGGCASCRLLPVCKTRLANRSEKDKGMLWKKIDHTINMFRAMSPDMGTAQLLCRKPSASGLVYGRLEENENTISLQDAFSILTGIPGTVNTTLIDVVNQMKISGVKFYVGGDWGYTHNTSMVVVALMPNGDIWGIDSRAVSGLEFDQMLNMGIELRDLYRPVKWYMDTAEPQFIKTFKRNGMACAEFKKDVNAGIESVRYAIMDANGRRRLKILKHENNKYWIKALQMHHFKLDAQGNPTMEPDDSEWADICDATRYAGQNLFGAKGRAVMSKDIPHYPPQQRPPDPQHDWLAQKTRALAETQPSKGSGNGIVWDFTDGEE